MAPLTSSTRDLIRSMGRELNADVLGAVQALYGPEQTRLALERPLSGADLAYGEAPRQVLDIYSPTGSEALAPVLLWVHGGGFVRGDKRADGNPFNAHIGRWAARSGMVGVVMNYRLAPDHSWPAGGQDVGAAIDWISANIQAFSGDPTQIVVAGTSAGSTHIATHIALRPSSTGVRAAVLLSGIYGFADLAERDLLYFGSQKLYEDRRPLSAMLATPLPLLLVGAEFDPPRFQAETLSLIAARSAHPNLETRAHLASGHNHFSMACHIGGQDMRLSDEILDFIRDIARRPS